LLTRDRNDASDRVKKKLDKRELFYEEWKK